MTIPILSHPKTITQFHLARYQSLSTQLEALKKERGELEQQLIAQLSSGVQVEPGARSASLKTYDRRTVSWRAVVIRLKGAGYAQNVLSHTKPTTITQLVVR